MTVVYETLERPLISVLVEAFRNGVGEAMRSWQPGRSPGLGTMTS